MLNHKQCASNSNKIAVFVLPDAWLLLTFKCFQQCGELSKNNYYLQFIHQFPCITSTYGLQVPVSHTQRQSFEPSTYLQLLTHTCVFMAHLHTRLYITGSSSPPPDSLVLLSRGHHIVILHSTKQRRTLRPSDPRPEERAVLTKALRRVPYSFQTISGK